VIGRSEISKIRAFYPVENGLSDQVAGNSSYGGGSPVNSRIMADSDPLEPGQGFGVPCGCPLKSQAQTGAWITIKILAARNQLHLFRVSETRMVGTVNTPVKRKAINGKSSGGVMSEDPGQVVYTATCHEDVWCTSSGKMAWRGCPGFLHTPGSRSQVLRPFVPAPLPHMRCRIDSTNQDPGRLFGCPMVHFRERKPIF